MEASYMIIQMCVGIATLATLVFGLLKMFASAAEAKATRSEALTASRRAEASAKNAAEHAQAAGSEIAKVAGAVETVIKQTNGMSHRLEQLAGAAGEARGREEEREEEIARQAGVANP